MLRLLLRLRDEIGCSIVFITHDLGVAAQISDRIAVLYAGRIAEIGPTADVLNQPAHPYTHGLLRSRLTLDTARHRKLAALAGSVPSPVTPLPGCAFAPRCVLATLACEATPPDPTTIAPGRVSACIVPFETVSTELGSRLTTTTEDIEPETAPAESSEPPAVVLKDGVKAFGKLQALRGISLTVAARRIRRAGRRERIGKVHAAAGHRRPGETDFRHYRARGWPAAADGVPGCGRIADAVAVGR